MTPERWRRIENLFHQVREQPPGTRAAFLARTCAGDDELRREVESLLGQPDDSRWGRAIEAAVADLVPPATSAGYEGRSLGPYVMGPIIGRGGMGEVYRARDARLGRDVAVKILPDSLQEHPDRLARFTREARILATLNHPNIGAIYGLEEVDGIRGLILELVEGTTLADRLAAGSEPAGTGRALPLDETLAIARQVAEALTAAHQKSIVHRDLKPANIAITPRGTVKVIDFGVAKSDAPEPAGDQAPAAPPSMASTKEGHLLGTVAYMSPEQARGQSVDRRTDIWAFGCVLFEMLVGSRPFAGNTSADVLAAIMTREPDWSRLPETTPERIRQVLLRCLAKDPNRRFHDMADIRLEIEDAASQSPQSARIAKAGRWRAYARQRSLWGAVGIAAALILAVLFLPELRGNAGDSGPAPVRAAIELPEDLSVYAIGRGSSVAVSPDGRRIAYVAVTNDGTHLRIRPLDGIDSQPVRGTEGATNPFFSPDGRWLGFWIDRRLKKVPVEGGTPTLIAEGASFLGAAWGADGSVLFATGPPGCLWRVRAGAEGPEQVTIAEAGTLNHSWPAFVPGGGAFTYTRWSNTGFGGGQVVVQKFDGPAAVIADKASYGRVIAVDARRAYLVYATAEGLLAAPFDVRTLTTVGPAVTAVDGVLTNLSGGAHFDISPNGALVYIPGSLTEAEKTALWVTRKGEVTPVRPIPGIGFQYGLSPDGRRIVRPAASGSGRDLWIDELADQGASIRLTFGAITNAPIWTADGRRVIYTSGVPNGNLYWRAADGSGDEERLTTSPNLQIAGSVAPDGTLAYAERDPARGFDIWMLSLRAARRQPSRLFPTPMQAGHPRFSPDGRWLAYQSNVTSTVETYVTSVTAPDRRLQVSRGGGFSPTWSADGRELFYRTSNPDQGGGDMIAVTVKAGDPLPIIGAPQVLFHGPFQGSGAVAPDGRFLLLKPTTREAGTRVIRFVLNWFADLQSRVPTR